MYKLKAGIVPAYILEAGETPQSIEDDMCYVIGSNGLFKKISHPLYDAIHPIDSIPGLATIEESTHTSVFKIPLNLLIQVGDFFKEVYGKYKSEAVVILFYNQDENKWNVYVPEQEVSAAGVSYDSITTMDGGFNRMGTIHSHANFNAFHSGTDDKDEESFDGLHITIGNVDGNSKSYAARIMCSGKEIKYDIINMVTAQQYDATVPSDWIGKIKEKAYKYTAYNGNVKRTGFNNDYGHYEDKKQNYKKLTEADLQPLTEEEKLMIASGNFLYAT